MMSASTLAIGLSSAVSVALIGWAFRERRSSRRNRGDCEAVALSENERLELPALRHSHLQLQERLRLLQARADETERELAALSYSISHDLRAPLRGIDGFSQALAEDYGQALDPTAHDYLRRVRAGTLYMSALIDDLLALSQVVRAPLRAEPVDVSAVARQIAGNLSASESTRLARWDIPADIVAVADRALLTELLRQLLTNAWKFTSRRDVAQVSLRVLPADPDHPACTVYQVHDNGVGFDMQYAGKLFGAFQRMHGRDEFPSGRGIGLAIVQRIVRRHGGRVWAASMPGQGTTLSFTLEDTAQTPGSGEMSVARALAPRSTAEGAPDAALPKATTV